MRKTTKPFDLESLLEGLGKISETLVQLAEKGEEFKRTGEISGLGEKARGVYGISIRTMGGKPHVESFGNIRKTENGPIIEDVREPLVDCFEENDTIRVIVEMPGMEEKDIELNFNDDILEIKAESNSRKYAREVLLPAAVDEGGKKVSFRNGILEVTAPKRKK